MPYNYLTDKFDVLWGHREGAMEYVLPVASGEELYPGDLVVLAPGGAQAGKLVKVGDVGVAEDTVGPVYNVLPSFKQMQDGSAAPGALVTPRPIWVVFEGNMTPSGIGVGGGKAVCLAHNFILQTTKFAAGTYPAGDAVGADLAAFAVQGHVNDQIGATGVFVTTDRQDVGFVIEHDTAEGLLIVQIP